MNRSDEQLSELFTALAHVNRVRIVEVLRTEERCQCELPEQLGIKQSNLSRHVKLLTSAGVLRVRRDGTRMILSVADQRVVEILDTLREVQPVLSVPAGT
ncbi:MAG: winged helix-turn-helix transcriptional regulator [Bacteroidetes bacterium]|nr:winged helix-turn-helix transcriptional regulator [Bacteroidota bacterium]